MVLVWELDKNSHLLGARNADLLLLKFAVPSYFFLHGAVARFVVDGFGQNFGLLFSKFNANSCLSSKFTFIRDKKGRLILLNFAVAKV